MDQTKTTKRRYIIACFFAVATCEEHNLLNMNFFRKGLIYNGEVLYILNHIDEYVNNEKYYQKYLEDK